MITRSGIGIDVHPLEEDKELVLGGLTIPFDKGLKGHSDGDVLIHAIIDAILGAAGLGDIGSHFPSDNPEYRGIASIRLLRTTLQLVGSHGWRVTYVDATIVAQRPTLSPYMSEIKGCLSVALSMDRNLVNVKAKTTDGLGFTGRGEGMAALAIATLETVA